jgi:hypothetical protein
MRHRLARNAASATAAMIAAALAVPASAPAAFYPGDPVDGPSADIVAVGDAAVARDGSGGVVYVKRDGGVDHVFLTRLAGGAFQPPERVDAGLAAASAQPVIAASDGGRLAIAFVNGGALFTAVKPVAAQPLTAPSLVATLAVNPSIGMSINGVAYVSFTANGDVAAARLERGGTTFAVLGAPLDANPAHDAGNGQSRSRIAVNAEGSAVVTWGEAGDDGRTHVIARRLFGMSLSVAPRDLTLDALDGHAGGSADSPDIDSEDDSSYAWVAFRQTFDNGGTPVSRAIARRLVGSDFDPPVAVDGLAFPAGDGADAPRIEMNGRGVGLAVVGLQSSNVVLADQLVNDAFLPPLRIDQAPDAIDPDPHATVAQTEDVVLAWLDGDSPAAAGVRARQFHHDKAGPEALLARPELGPVDAAGGFEVAGNRSGDAIAVFVQAAPDGRRLVVAAYDRPPGGFDTYTTSSLRSLVTRPLRWAASRELWGPITYTVQVDGITLGQTTGTSFRLIQPLRDGTHRWRVVATDRRGQTWATPIHILRVDDTAPALHVRVSGARQAGSPMTFTATARDPRSRKGVKASGMNGIRYSFGDRSRTERGPQATHVFRRGTFTVTITATDKAGNATVVTKRLRIR